MSIVPLAYCWGSCQPGLLVADCTFPSPDPYLNEWLIKPSSDGAQKLIEVVTSGRHTLFLMRNDNIPIISDSSDVACCSRSNWEIYGMGENSFGESGSLRKSENVSSVSLSTDNPRLIEFSFFDDYSIYSNTNLPNNPKLFCGWEFSAVLHQGRLFTWGSNYGYQLGLGHQEVCPTPTVMSFLDHDCGEFVTEIDEPRIINACLGLQHGAAIDNLGRIYGWGSNRNGINCKN